MVAADPSRSIPWENLPPGFARHLDAPPEPPAPARPAATVVLVRPGAGGPPEILLLRRTRRAGFVPGAWVFPGGRVDPEDADPALAARLTGVDPDALARRLDVEPGARPPAVAWLVAALREAFEETGILVTPDADRPPASGDLTELARLHRGLLEGSLGFAEVLEALDVRLHGASVAYLAHWITPRAEPRRYDTRFFLAAVPPRTEVRLHEAELSEAAWLPAEEALLRHRQGTMPMVFPTVHTLEALRVHDTLDALLDAVERRPVPSLLPRLVRGERGVRIVLPGEDPVEGEEP